MAKRAQRHSELGEQVADQWAGGMQEAFLGLRDWRALYPTAKLAEIEAELDRRLSRLRARMLADLALVSTATTLDGEARPACPDCGGPLHDEGVRTRTVMTMGHQ